MPRHYFNPDSPRVSLLIVRESFDDRIVGILSSIQKNNYSNYEVIVVNIGATDGQMNALHRHFPNIKQVNLNSGTEKEFALGEGIKIARGEYMLFLNAIEEINEDFIEHLVAASKKSKRIAIVSPQVRSFKHKEISLFRASADPNQLGSYFDFTSYKATKGTEEEKPRFAHFACNDAFLVSLEFLQNLEEQQKSALFFLDEIDMAETVHGARYKIFYEPNAIAYLQESVASSAENTYYKTRNRLASIRKHKHGMILLGLLFFFSISSLPKHTFQHLLHLRLDHIFAFYRGVLWNLLHSFKTGGFLSNFKWKQPL